MFSDQEKQQCVIADIVIRHVANCRHGDEGEVQSMVHHQGHHAYNLSLADVLCHLLHYSLTSYSPVLPLQN